ncbi:hypothetical protein AB0C02_29095 [Micromonospora sp. NPDC048999]|uniref:hypothetical protein n=1 Tax=Micromonospora sp. NPDC048999 TaxID=3155391 RepID=UPI0033EC5190
MTRAAADLLTAEGWFAQHPHLRVGLDQLADGVEPETRFAPATERAQTILDAYQAQCAGDGRVRRSPDCARVA